MHAQSHDYYTRVSVWSCDCHVKVAVWSHGYHVLVSEIPQNSYPCRDVVRRNERGSDRGEDEMACTPSPFI